MAEVCTVNSHGVVLARLTMESRDDGLSCGAIVGELR